MTALEKQRVPFIYSSGLCNLPAVAEWGHDPPSQAPHQAFVAGHPARRPLPIAAAHPSVCLPSRSGDYYLSTFTMTRATPTPTAPTTTTSTTTTSTQRDDNNPYPRPADAPTAGRRRRYYCATAGPRLSAGNSPVIPISDPGEMVQLRRLMIRACQVIHAMEAAGTGAVACDVSGICGALGAGPGLMQYVDKVVGRMALSAMELATAVVYLHRFQRRYGSIPKDSGYGLFVAAALLGHKYLRDRPRSNRLWASSVGAPLAEINGMEVALLAQLDFALHVTDAERDAVQAIVPVWPTGLSTGSSLADYITSASAVSVPRLSMHPAPAIGLGVSLKRSRAAAFDGDSTADGSSASSSTVSSTGGSDVAYPPVRDPVSGEPLNKRAKLEALY